MTLVENQLFPKSKYEDIAAQVQLERYRVKLPDRTARIIIESPTLAQLDPEFEDFEGYQKRKATEEAKRAEMARVAEETGAPTHLLRALQERPSNIRLDTTAHDEQHARALQLGLDEETRRLDIAIRNEQNVQSVANQAVQNINEAHLVNPIHQMERARASPLAFILAEQDDDDIPITYPRRDRIPVPAVPDYERAARALNEAGRTNTGTSALDFANTALQTTGAIANAGAAVAPLLGGLIQGTGQGLMLGGRAALGTARLGASVTSSASRGVANAMSSLMQAGMPISHRGHDHLERNGINITQGLGHFMRSHRHLG
jgi:DNA-binding phage protein